MFTAGTNNRLATSRNDRSWEQYLGGLATSRIALSTGSAHARGYCQAQGAGWVLRERLQKITSDVQKPPNRSVGG